MVVDLRYEDLPGGVADLSAGARDTPEALLVAAAAGRLRAAGAPC